MADPEETDEEVPDAPATWENVAVGKAKEVVGHLVGDTSLTEDGEEQEEIAHEVRGKFDDDHNR